MNVNLCFSLTIFSLVFYYNLKSLNENTKSFFFSMVLSLIGVYGVIQAIKTFNNRHLKISI